MATITNIYRLADQIKDTIAVHGHATTAKMFAKNIPFTIFHYFAFGVLPRTVLKIEAGKTRVIHTIV